MIKQKVALFLQSAFPFGLSVSFARCFIRPEQTSALILLIAGLFLILLATPFPKIRKRFMERCVRLQPLAAVVFAASIILAFVPYPKVWPMLFVTLILDAVCLCMVFEAADRFDKKAFLVLTSAGSLAGMVSAFAGRAVFLYMLFVLLSLSSRPEPQPKTAQDVWKDIAFPLFVLIGSFIVFIAANHGGAFSLVAAQSIVMLMTGGLLMTSSSALRLTLMTVVMIIFGSYVFSAGNSESVFNRSARGGVRIEAPAPRHEAGHPSGGRKDSF